MARRKGVIAKQEFLFADVDMAAEKKEINAVKRRSRREENAVMYEGLREFKASKTQVLVLRALDNAGQNGLTDFEGADQTNLYINTYGPTRNKLFHEKLCFPTAETRPSPRGSPAQVWVSVRHFNGTLTPEMQPDASQLDPH